MVLIHLLLRDIAKLHAVESIMQIQFYENVLRHVRQIYINIIKLILPIDVFNIAQEIIMLKTQRTQQTLNVF
jgi:hypothetical protein